jgi:signal peptide peptidase SppA
MKPRIVVLVLLLLIVATVAVATILIAGAILVLSGETPSLFGGDKVALARIEGLLYDSEFWLNQLTNYGEDSSVRAVVIRIDSPGGLVSPSQELHRAVCDLRERYNKVVVASFGSVAASGGYYVGCAADRIVSAPGTMTGSIGVYMKFWQGEDLLERIGVGSETLRAGNFKDFGGFDRRLTSEERQMLQSVIEDTYDQFVEAVQETRKERLLHVLQSDPEVIRSTKRDADGKVKYPFTPELLALIEEYNRAIPWAAKSTVEGTTEELGADQEEVVSSTASMSADTDFPADPEKVLIPPGLRRATPAVEQRLIQAMARHVADGKVYTGRQALDIGLVDQIGTLDDAIKLAAKLAGLKGKPSVIEKKQKRSFLLDLLLKGFTKATATQVYPSLQYRLPF